MKTPFCTLLVLVSAFVTLNSTRLVAQTTTTPQIPSLVLVDSPTPELTANQLLARALQAMPTTPLDMSGTVTIRRQRGVILNTFPYEAQLRLGSKKPHTQYTLFSSFGSPLEQATLWHDGSLSMQYSTGTDLSVTNAPIMTARVRGTDITWLDLSLDYLHWTSAELVGEDKVKNRDCHIILVAPPAPLPGCSAMKSGSIKK